MKRAIAYIGSPRQFSDFLWYYLAYGREYAWDVVCPPDTSGMRLKESFRNSGVVHHIYPCKPFFNRPKGELAGVALQMTLCWLVGQNKRFASKEVKKIIDIRAYERMCIGSTASMMIAGLMALAGIDCMPVDLLEDGIGDNPDPHKKFNIRRLTEKDYLASYLLAAMGYFNHHALFPLESSQQCTRYSINPAVLHKELYKEVRLLNDMSLVDQNEYEYLIHKTFDVTQIGEDFEAVLFTAPLKDFTKDFKHYNIRVLEYLKRAGYHKILLKKHPRDDFDYSYDDLRLIKANSWVPSEYLLDSVRDFPMFFMTPSSTIRAIRDKTTRIHIFKYSALTGCAYSDLFDIALEEIKKAGNIGQFQVIEI